jgi:hypothetical protein
LSRDTDATLIHRFGPRSSLAVWARPAHLPPTLAFGLVPLVVSPVLADQFINIKWYLLELLAVVWLLGEALARRAAPCPGFVRQQAVPLVAFGALTVLSALRGGLAWGMEPLLARATFAILCFCAYAYFSRNRGQTSAVEAGLIGSLAVVVAIGLSQVLGLTRAMGLEPLFGLRTGDGRSATFGNANMAAQFAGIALSFLVAIRATGADLSIRARTVVRDVLAAAALAYVILVGARSVMLALGFAFSVIVLLSLARGRATRRGPLVLTAIVAVLVAVSAWSSAGLPGAGGLRQAFKAQSVGLRRALVQQTFALILDRPLGAGAGNFLHAFLPYQLRDDALRSETLVYASPHNELLRAMAEEGVAWCALAAYLLFRLAAAVRRRAQREGWPGIAVVIAAGAAFLLVESTFQFPFALAFPTLAAAVLLGLALSYGDDALPAGAPPPLRGKAWRLAAIAVVALAAVALWRLVASDYLTATATQDAAAQREACRLNPRNLRACLRVAWLHAEAGRRLRARQRLIAVLERSPYYYPAIKLLADESTAHGDHATGCFHLWVYDALFEERSTVHATLSATCDPSLLDEFRRRAMVPGYERFPLLAPVAEKGE